MKPEGTIGLHSVCLSLCYSVCHSVILSVCHTSFPDFSWLCFHISEWKLVASFYMKSYRSGLTFITVDLLFMSYCPSFIIRFPDFSWLCFHISKWKLVASFHMKSYSSSLTSVTVDLLFHELLSFNQNSFSGFLLAMLSQIWMKVGSKLPYEKLQIKFDFQHSWITFYVACEA